ncbi:hypothetical protein ABPG73_019639 [Tetrahymena malaccensis]
MAYSEQIETDLIVTHIISRHYSAGIESIGLKQCQRLKLLAYLILILSMVRPKDSIAISKRKNQKAIVDFKQIRSTRRLVIGLILICIFLSFAFTGDIAFNLSFLILTILQSVQYDQNVIDVRFILPLVLIIVLVLIFIFKGFIFYQGMYVLLKKVKNNISTALISQKSFNEKLLQSLIPDDAPNRDEQIQHSLDELEYVSRQASDITPSVNSQIKYKQNNYINF